MCSASRHQTPYGKCMQDKGQPKGRKTAAACAEIVIDNHQGLNYKRLLVAPNDRAHARSSLKISTAGGEIRIKVLAKDVTALRASINSIMRDVQVIDAVGGPNSGDPHKKQKRG